MNDAAHPHLGRPVPDYDLVENTVRDVLRVNFISEPPVSPIEISQNYAIKVLFANFSEEFSAISGLLDIKNINDMSIYVNRAEPPRRQTFTIAHELGHALLHAKLFSSHPEEYKVLLRTPLGSSNDPLEQEANAFAAHLLVPGPFLEKYSRIATDIELARLFNVSDDVIRFRKANESRNRAT